jgi:toxin ParE1/3/4
MEWKVVARPQAQNDLLEAADWYESRCSGLGIEFLKAVVEVLDALTLNPLMHCKQHPTKNIRWRLTKKFRYRVVYEVIEDQRLVVVAAILHVARNNNMWLRRFSPN